MSAKALILFAHGARDPRWAAPFERLQQLASASLPQTTVRLAFLELMTPQLPDTVATLVADGCSDVTIVPVFLGQGGHVLRDLPLLITDLHNQYPTLDIKVAAAVGENPAVLQAIAEYCVTSID
jgi:sirohydrochlorin cobaltochelatase